MLRVFNIRKWHFSFWLLHSVSQLHRRRTWQSQIRSSTYWTQRNRHLQFPSRALPMGRERPESKQCRTFDGSEFDFNRSTRNCLHARNKGISVTFQITITLILFTTYVEQDAPKSSQNMQISPPETSAPTTSYGIPRTHSIPALNAKTKHKTKPKTDGSKKRIPKPFSFSLSNSSYDDFLQYLLKGFD